MPMKLANGERLILFMLGEIHKHLKIEGDIDPDFVMKAVIDGRDWALASKYSGFFSSEPDDEQDVRETHDILTMFRVLASSYARLNKDDKARVDTEAAPFSGKDLKFGGFDGNHDPHHGIASFIVNDLGLYQELQGHAMNSHSSVLEVYRRMHRAYEPFLRDFPADGFSADQLIEILKARSWR
jgi:uncharacterized protein YfbU (UPF0304 family)